jgi:hypothetical protein
MTLGELLLLQSHISFGVYHCQTEVSKLYQDMLDPFCVTLNTKHMSLYYRSYIAHQDYKTTDGTIAVALSESCPLNVLNRRKKNMVLDFFDRPKNRFQIIRSTSKKTACIHCQQQKSYDI